LESKSLCANGDNNKMNLKKDDKEEYLLNPSQKNIYDDQEEIENFSISRT